MIEITPRDDLSPEDYRRLGELLRSLAGDIGGGDKLAVEDLFGGEPPRPTCRSSPDCVPVSLAPSLAGSPKNLAKSAHYCDAL